VQKISKTLAVIGMLSPVGANALGIGDIRLHSALNQTLRAEIPLVTSGSESIQDIKVSIASAEAFSRAGVERNYQLSQLRFTPIQKPDGSYAIQVSSREAIREPFLNFLVEVNWPQGRLLREFTVLLDPPAAYKEETVVEPALPATSYAPRSRAVDAAPRPRESAVSAPVRSSPRESAPPASRVRGSEYGPVRRNETLWSIARSINRDPSVTPEQMVVGLYEANPHAFFKDSLNALKAGETLTIPDRQTLLRISPREARAQVYGQPSARAGKVTETPAPKPPRDTVRAEPAGEGQLKLLAPTEAKAKGETAGTAAREDVGKAKGDIALEVADTVKQENEEIRSRLAQLEQQLSNMHRLLTLKDEQIASLQQQQQQRPVPAPAPEAEHVPVPTPPVVAPPSERIAPPVAPQPSPQPTPEVAQPTPPPVPSPPPVARPTPQVTPERPVVPPAPAPVVETDSGFTGDPLVFGLGAAGVTLLGAYFWRGYRRRQALTQESESILISPVRERSIEPAFSGFAALDKTPSEQASPSAARSSFLSEFSTSDFDALGGEVDEVDPISEADVYLAYGRYKQAEELIRNAIQQHPDHDECKLKLLEIHYATENHQAFEAYAKELFNEHKDADPEFWDKVVEMGREICPNSPLFGRQEFAEVSGKKGAPLTDDELTASLELDDDLLAELRNFELEDQPLGPDSQATEPRTAPARPGDTSSVKRPVAPDAFAALDFEVVKIPEHRPDEAAPVVDVDNMIQFESTKPNMAKEFEVVQTGKDKTLDDILVEMGAVPARSGSRQSPDEKGDQDDFDLDFSLIKPPSPPSELEARIAKSVENESMHGLEGMDEIETRLDLAKAFVDMGDETSARQILEDIRAQGGDSQRREAQALLDKLVRENAQSR
jgi:pilus assembly protein FimV